MSFAASFWHYFSVTLIRINKEKSSSLKCNFFVFHIGWDSQVSCSYVNLSRSWSNPVLPLLLACLCICLFIVFLDWYVIIIVMACEFFIPALPDGLSPSDSKSPQVSRTLFSILADFNNAVVWMVSTNPLISKSSSPFAKPFVIVPSVPITSGITFMSHSFLVLWQGLCTFLSFCFLLFSLYGLPGRQSQLFSRFSFFGWLSLSLVIWPRLDDLFVFQNPREFYAFHSPGWILVCAYILLLLILIRVFHISVNWWSFTGD